MRLVTGVTAVAIVLVTAGLACATPKMLADAKKAGVPATNCQYCHSETAPKKDTFKPETLNERGKFLMTDKQTRNLKDVDVGKLKESKGGTEKK
jgi:hypothetical protein